MRTGLVGIFLFGLAVCQVLADDGAPSRPNLVIRTDYREKLPIKTSLLWQMLDGIVTGLQTDSSLLQVPSFGRVTYKGRDFYSLPHQPKDVYFESVALANRLSVVRCTQNPMKFPSKKVSVMASRLCKKGFFEDLVQKHPVGYRTYFKDGGIHLAISMRFLFSQYVDEKRASEMMNNTRSCFQEIQNVWARYGIQFHAEIDSARDRKLSSVEHEIYLRDLSDVSYVSDKGNEFFYLGQTYYSDQAWCARVYKDTPERCTAIVEEMRQREFCGTVMHEVGHLMGLPDEYADPLCPDRIGVPKTADEISLVRGNSILHYNVMFDDHHPLNEMDYYKHHVDTILAPLCGP